MEHTALSRLDTRELLLHADNARDPLTTSDIEIELANRLAALVELVELDDALTNVGLERQHLQPLLELLAEHDATDIDVLRKQIERAALHDQLVEAAENLATLLHEPA